MLRHLSNSNFLIPAMVILAVLATGAGFYISIKQSQQTDLLSANKIDGLFWPNPKQINEFAMNDHHGEKFNVAALGGKWSFIFFGYTHCPDICPITMATMATVYQQLHTEYDDTQVIFVSVDSNRDTSEKLAQYVHYFNPDFIGITDDSERANSLTKQIGIAYYVNDETEGNYLVDHSASIFLVDPERRLVGKFSTPHETKKIIQQFKKIKAFIDNQQ